jgi:lactoylglutathione lyase
MTAFTSIGHVALRVKDIDRSLAFYTGRLGCREVMRLLYADGSLFLIYLRVTDDQFLELFPEGVGDRAPGREVVAINHICLTVGDLDRTVADLVAAGVTIAREIRTGADGNRQAWIDDPDGNRIEIMEMSPASVQFAAVARTAAGGEAIVRTTAIPRPASFA